MANSKIVLTFNSDLDINQQIGFKIGNFGSPSFVDQKYVWKTTRAGYGQVTKGVPTSNIGERSAINFMQAFNLDWNYGGTYFNVSRILNVVTIQANYPNIMFSSFFSIDDLNAIPTVSNTDVTAVITNNSAALFEVESITYTEADTLPCQNVKINIETSVLATKILSPVIVDPNTENPFSIEILRGSNPITLTIEDVDGNIVNQLIEVPKILSPNNFQLQINNYPNGATVVINNGLVPNRFNLLDLEYSLDNITWQTSNVFSGLIAGNYTVYIKDQLGCSTSIDFTVTEFGIYEPYFNISKANSLRFANRVDFGDSANYKTDENTLSCEADVLLPYKETQLFQTADVVTTQFKSNYELNEVKVIKEDLSEVVVPVIKKSNYIGVKDLRDARKYDLGNGQTAIYFTTGNIYDFNTGLPTGEIHYLNGGLPIWASSGNYVKVDAEWFLIEDILFDESKNSEIIVISSNYSGGDVSAIAGTIYNVFDYEIYEFAIDMVDYIDETIKVRIVASDDNFTTVTNLSEDLNIQVKQENTKSINYWNNDNTDIFYATGIKHQIRIPWHKRSGIAEEDSEVHKTDTNSI